MPSTKDTPGYGFSPSAYWVKVDIDRHTHSDQAWMLKFGYAPMQWVDVYVVHNNGEAIHQQGGMHLAINDRPKPNYYQHVFELALPHSSTLYVRVGGETSKNIPLFLYEKEAFGQASMREATAFALYIGIVIALACYNLAIFFTIRDISHLLYVLFVVTYCGTTLGLFGVTQWLFMDAATLRTHFIPSGMGAATLFAWLFTLTFLQSRKTAPRFHKLLLVGVAWSIMAIVMPWLADYRTSIIFAGALAAYSPVMALIFACIQARRRIKAAEYYLLAWIFLLLGLLLNIARVFGLLPNTYLTEYGQIWGSAAEAILLSVALAARMREMKEEKERAQLEQLRTQEALNISQAETVEAQQESLNNKQIALDAIQQYNTKLEAEVVARTGELIETQQKLIASEKMAALGVFTAGMAHEINNPANFVSVGAQNSAAQLAEFRGFVSELLSDDPDPEITEAFDTRFRKLEKSNSTIAEGISRIENIVKQLRVDHPEGDTGMQPADAVAALESACRTFMLSQAGEIMLTADYAARPIVPCLIAEVQQVFLALLSNAAHAIEDAVAARGPDYKGEIKLASREADRNLIVTVSDNGIGIPADMINKVFDPFFTTKTVGRGAGLGLSMARDVVKKHGGTLEVKSTVGEGTTFTLELGLTQPG